MCAEARGAREEQSRAEGVVVKMQREMEERNVQILESQKEVEQSRVEVRAMKLIVVEAEETARKGKKYIHLCFLSYMLYHKNIYIIVNLTFIICI